MKILNQATQYISYLFRSIHLHGIHSPFIYSLHQNVIKEKTPYYAFDDIESIRAKLLLSKQKIKVKDLGAGSKSTSNTELRSIKSIAKKALKSPKYAQLIFRLAYHFKSENILELGTSLGITTAYLSKACPASKIISIEGCDKIAKVATVNLKKLDVLNVKQQIGHFKEALNPALSDLKTLDLLFVDGNHKKAATLDYFHKCLDYAHENSLFIFDDIYWSKEMTEAWNEIKKHPKVTCTIDLFQMGIVFFKKDQAKEHFTVYH